jgi:hypothetical protein
LAGRIWPRFFKKGLGRMAEKERLSNSFGGEKKKEVSGRW